ncbi:MAG TPA: TIGR03936 family radical SAM-associated protein [Capillibacterium sp.]
MKTIKYRIKYSKTGVARFTSHLDVIRALSRALHRAGLPVAFSAGFNPKPQLAFGPPLPLGVESEAEYFDLVLTTALPEEEVTLALRQNLPPGLTLLSVQPLPEKAPSLMTQVTGLDYRFYLTRKEPWSDRQVEAWFGALWSRPELTVTKKTATGEKQVDLKPLWLGYELSFQRDGLILFQVRVAFGPQGTVRPDDFRPFLAPAFQIGRVRRTAVTFKTGERRQKVL